MRNLLIMALTGVLLFAGNALAVDDMWDDDDVIKENPEATSDSEPVEVNADAPHNAAMNHPGAYFGADGYYLPGTSYSSNVEHDHSVDYNGQTIYFPEYGNSASQLYENVYGPLWGVPSDAVGMEGYDPYYYYLMMMADPAELSAEQRREIEEHVQRMQEGNQQQEVPREYAEDTVNELEGLDMTDDYWD